MPKIDRTKIPFTNNASYPKEFAPVIEGREKQKSRNNRESIAFRDENGQHRKHM